MKKLLFILLLAFFGCGTTLTGISFNNSASDSEKTIKNETKSYTVLGNLRVVITREDDYYDKIMKSAIKKYGEGVDIINIKEDFTQTSKGALTTTSPIIVNCLVITYH